MGSKNNLICINCKQLIYGNGGNKQFIKKIENGIRSLGYEYHHDMCPDCNSARIIKRMIDKGDPITKATLEKLTKRLYFDDNEKTYVDKFDEIIKGLKKE